MYMYIYGVTKAKYYWAMEKGLPVNQRPQRLKEQIIGYHIHMTTSMLN